MTEETIGPKDRQRIAIVEASEAGKRMLRRRGKKTSTRLIYVRGALLFSKFLGKSLDDIVNEYKADAEKNLYKAFDKWEQIFEDFSDWLQERHGEGTTASTYFQGGVALINANVPKSTRIQPSGPPATPRTIPPITMEDLRTVRAVADERERAFIDFLKDSGISRDDAIRLTYGIIKKAVEDEAVRFLKIDMYRAKESVEYETWIGPNAIESLRIYFMVRRQRGEQITDNTPIFASDMRPHRQLNRRSFSQVFRRLTKKTGIAISTHRLRKFFETYIVAGGAPPITAKYWMGHKIRGGRDIEARYILPPENLQREQYMKAYDHIDVVPKLTTQELSEARIRAELETMSPEAAKRYIGQLTRRYTFKPDFQRLLKQIEKERAEENTDCPDGVNCGERFEKIEEGELLTYLRNGWQIVHKLETGEVIVTAKT